MMEENKLIHSSKVPSKHSLTTESSFPSKILKVLMVCNRRNRIFYLKGAASSAVPVNSLNKTAMISDATLWSGSSEFASL